MVSQDGRGGLLSAGGILSIIVGAFELIGGIGVGILLAIGLPAFRCFPDCLFGEGFNLEAISIRLIVTAIVLGILGIIAIAGGASAIRRGSFGLSLAGAICALLPINILGILAVIFVSLGKREF